jgi:hypothetical protein
MKAQEHNLHVVDIIKETNESSVFPSYRCSINEEIDEGDICKNPIYN